MNFFRHVLLIIASSLMMIQSSFAGVSQAKLNELNELSNIDGMKNALFHYFKTAEDKRNIETDIIKMKAIAKKWVWRYERQGDAVAFRLNGKVQFAITAEPGNPNVFFINGEKVSIKSGQSYQSFIENIDKALKKTAFNLDDLMFRKAHAFIWKVFVGAAVLFGVYRWGYANGKKKCHTDANCTHDTCQREGEQGAHRNTRRSTPNQGRRAALRCINSGNLNRSSSYFPVASNRKGRAYFRSGRVCPAKSMPRNIEARHPWVVRNFKPNGKFRYGGGYKDSAHKRCAASHQVNSGPYLVCRCVERKTSGDCDYGWNMTPGMADATCKMAYESYLACSGNPAPPVQYDVPSGPPQQGTKTQPVYTDDVPSGPPQGGSKTSY